MIQIITTDDYIQQQTIVAPDNSLIQLTIKYVPMQYGWFIQELDWNTYTIQTMRITNNPNILYQFQNQFTFGLACFSQGTREPTQLEDFNQGYSSLYVLSQAEVLQYTESINA
jgi:hypothetical protein